MVIGRIVRASVRGDGRRLFAFWRNGPVHGPLQSGWLDIVARGVAHGTADFVPAVKGLVPCPPVAAFLVGFLLYALLAKIGLEEQTARHARGATVATAGRGATA